MPMDKEILYFSLYAKKSFNQILNKPKSELYAGIRKSDFLISDAKGTHRLLGVFYDADKMDWPQISFICMKSEIVIAKQIAFELGKKILPDEELSALLFRNHIIGETVEKSTWRPLAKLYVDLGIY